MLRIFDHPRVLHSNVLLIIQLRRKANLDSALVVLPSSRLNFQSLSPAAPNDVCTHANYSASSQGALFPVDHPHGGNRTVSKGDV